MFILKIFNKKLKILNKSFNKKLKILILKFNIKKIFFSL